MMAFAGRFLQFLRYWYFQWELASMLYVMDPGERIVFHLIIGALISLIIYAGVNSVPGYCVLAIQIINSVLTGNYTEGIAA